MHWIEGALLACLAAAFIGVVWLNLTKPTVTPEQRKKELEQLNDGRFRDNRPRTFWKNHDDSP